MQNEETTQITEQVARIQKPQWHTLQYKDSDMLTAAQVAAIWSENSGYSVLSCNVSAVTKRRGIPVQKFGKVNQYRYGDIKEIVLSRHNCGPKLLANPSPRTLYMRDYKRRKRQVSTDQCEESMN